MICGFSAFHARILPQSQQKRIFGTWDFKWRPGKEIRIAFQELPHLDPPISFHDLMPKVVDYASRWNDSGSPLKLAFLQETLPAPDPGLPAGKSADGKKRVDYDVLVSLAPLPFRVSYKIKGPPNKPGQLWSERTIDRTADGKPMEIPLPTAQLGRFALRCDYGVPTVYLGRPNRTTTPSAATLAAALGLTATLEQFVPTKDDTLADYFGTRKHPSKTGEFECTIVHEFGHVLGIPHLHQSPLARLRWRSVKEICSLISAGTGVEVDEDFVRGQALLPLPSTRSAHGDALFSDWSAPAMDRYGDAVLDSVMTHPLLQFMLEPPNDPALANKVPVRITTPTSMDFDFLRSMYSER